MLFITTIEVMTLNAPVFIFGMGEQGRVSAHCLALGLEHKVRLAVARA